MEKQTSKKNRGKGNGYIFKRGSIYYLQYDVSGKRKKVSLGETTLRKAQKKAKELTKPVREADTKEKIAIHVGEARGILKQGNTFIKDTWNLYMKCPARPDSSPGTLGNYERHWKQFKDWLNGEYPVTDKLGGITPDIAKKYFEKLWAKGLSANTYNYHRQSLRLIFRVVKEETGLSGNPFDSIAKKSENKQSRKELKEDEVLALLKKFDSEDLKLMHKEQMGVMFHLGAWTGLRLIDCAKMKWEDVNIEQGKITCVPQKTARKSQKPVTIPIHPTLYVALQKAKAWKQNEYVLPKVAHRYSYNANGVDQDALEVFRKAGFDTTQEVPEKGQRKRKANIYGFHSFRHSFVSFCANAGVPLPVVQSIVGHGNC